MKQRTRILATSLLLILMAMTSVGVSAQTTSSFNDVPPDHVHYEDVKWAESKGITLGCTPPTNLSFCPDMPVTRGQMAAFLVRALDLPATGDQGFVDIGASVFTDDVNRLAAAGITGGCNPPDNDRFCPEGEVTRGQMAAFLSRALDLPAAEDQGFIDSDGIFTDEVNRLAAAGITTGCNPPENDRFCPEASVTRAQMAAFLRRALTDEPLRQGAWEIVAFDVGQGDAFLLRGPDFTVLVDAGPRQVRTTMREHLVQAGVEEIDLFVLTHPDYDHITRAPEVLDNFEVEEVWTNGDTYDSDEYRDTMEAIRRSDARYHEPRAGETHTIGSARLDVHWPRNLNGTTNNNSIVFSLTSAGVTALLSADAQAEAEAGMAASGADLSADILKVGHHAGDTSSTPEYLDAIDPRVAFYQVGKDNPHGMPHQVVLDRLAARDVDVYGTQIFGTITISINNGKIDVDGEYDLVPVGSRVTQMPSSKRTLGGPAFRAALRLTPPTYPEIEQ